MRCKLISKYLNKKKNNLLSYANELENLIEINNNNLWHNKAEFKSFIKGIIDIYVENYYFDNNINRYNPIEYSNDNINSIMQSIIEYCKKINKENLLLESKNEIFLIAVILCSACYIDIASNVIDGNIKEVKDKLGFLLQYFNKIEILNVKINDNVLKRLFDKLKENNLKEKKFFEAFDNDDYYNEYIPCSMAYGFYLVKFKYKIKELEGINSKVVKSASKKYESKLRQMSYDLLEVKLLKEYISNNRVSNYIISPINSKNIFYDDILSKNIYILVDYKDKGKYQNKIEFSHLNFIYKINSIDEIENINTKDLFLVCNKLDDESIYKIKEINNNKIKFIVNYEEE